MGLLETKQTEVIYHNWRRIGKSLTLNLSECRATKALISRRRESLARKEGRRQLLLGNTYEQKEFLFLEGSQKEFLKLRSQYKYTTTGIQYAP